jgi:hypothetical protein
MAEDELLAEIIQFRARTPIETLRVVQKHLMHIGQIEEDLFLITCAITIDIAIDRLLKEK